MQGEESQAGLSTQCCRTLVLCCIRQREGSLREGWDGHLLVVVPLLLLLW